MRKAEKKAEREAQKAEIEARRVENAKAIEKGEMKSGDFFIVGGKLYRWGLVEEEDGSSRLAYEPWSFGALTKDRYQSAPEYLRFRCIPSHDNYKQVKREEFNSYQRLTHIPKQGNWDTIKNFLKHIFKDQLEFGIEYFRVLWRKPMQRLPILILVSEERQTGKTTFLNFLSDIFQGNFTYNTNEQFDSPFNSDWVGKLIVGVDEAVLDGKRVCERIKNISTSKAYKMESKGVNREQVDIFAKFVFCSNNEDNPVIIDKGEVRYWVRKIPKLPKEQRVKDLGERLKKEIPAFLHFLNTSKFFCQGNDRMWFDSEDIDTAALRHIKAFGKNRNECALADILMDAMEDLGVNEIRAIPKDLVDLCTYSNNSAKISYLEVKEVLKKNWGLTPQLSSLTYDKVMWEDNHFTLKKTHGRFYIINRETINYEK